MDDTQTKAHNLYKHILFQSQKARTYKRFTLVKELVELIESRNIQADDYNDLEKIANGNGLRPFDRLFGVSFQVREFLANEDIFRNVEIPIPFNQFSKEAQTFFTESISEKEVLKLFKSFPTGYKIGPYIFVGTTNMKAPPWTYNGRYEVAVWRNTIDPNALVE